MKYLIVQDWPSTHGNHAGMKHMCDLLVSMYPNKYEMYVKPFPTEWKYPTSLWGKIKQRLFGNKEKDYYLSHTFPNEYMDLCKPVFEKIKTDDEIFLLEYLLPWAPQYKLACYIREQYPHVKIYALSHLTCTFFDDLTAKEPDLITKWAHPIDKMMTLGTSLSSYFKNAGIMDEKISTGFHYVDHN